MNRIDISRLRKNYGMKLQFSLIIALAFVLSAFNYTTYADVYEASDYEPVEEDQAIEVTRTLYEPPKKVIIPPPTIEINEIIETETPEFIEEEKPEVVEEVVDVAPIEKNPVIMPKPKPKKIEKPVLLPKEEVPEAPPIYMGFEVEEMPRFNSCEAQDLEPKERETCALRAMKIFLRDKLNYPSIARENGVEGTAVVSFIVEKDGSISEIKLKRDPGAGLGKEAIRVIKSMPNWVPGKQRGRPVRVRFTMPVKFKLG